MLQPLRNLVKVIYLAPFNLTDHSTSAAFRRSESHRWLHHSRGPLVAIPTPDTVIMDSGSISSDHPTAEGGGDEAIEMGPIEHSSDVTDHSSARGGEEIRVEDVPQPGPSQTTQADHDDSLSMVGQEEYKTDGGLWRFEQMVPKSEDRYNRTRHIGETAPDIKSLTPQAFQRDFKYDNLPPGWERRVHSEGKVYYLHKEDRIITEDEMLDLRTATFIDRDFRRILSHTVERNVDQMPEDYHVVVRFVDLGYDPEDSRDPTGARYEHYVADHDKSLIFWLNVQEDFEIDISHFALRGELSPNQHKSILEWYYYQHVSYFPDARRPTDREWDELQLTLANAHMDLVTSPKSTIYLSPDKLDEMTKIVKTARRTSFVLGRIKESLRQYVSDPIHPRSCFFSVYGQIINYHGEPCARLNICDSVYEKTTERTPSFLFKILSPILLYAPDAHLKSLDKIWVDKITAPKVWNALVEKLNAEWNTYMLIATVFLTTNVAFLAIPVVDDTLKIHPLKSPSHIFSFLSTLANLCGIIMGLILMRHHRTKTLNAVDAFLHRMYGSNSGFENLAILYSFPYALLMWGVLFFTAAFVTMCFEADVPWMRIAMGLPVAIFLFVVLWCITKLWESDTWSSQAVDVFLNMLGWFSKSEENTKKALWLRVRDGFNRVFRTNRVRGDEESGSTAVNQS
ncbi:hypothetical protein BDZ89DRAFT_1012424 [Hymenopellis radicata]|nr:hypothetical protein BDZ89DRAFT_1012424 [Hymenopellis radicata]